MEKRRLGKTGFQVSIVGFGGIPIQRLDEKGAIELVEEAHRQGINFIDTARGYRNSEELLGKAINHVGREKFILATKSMDRTYKGCMEEIETSLRELDTDYIDLFQFHNVNDLGQLDQILSEDGAYRAAEELKNKGIIKEIGITSHSAEILDRAIDRDRFSTIQFPYNPVERQGEEVFKKAYEKDLGIIIMKPLAGGAIPKGELCLRFIFQNPHVTVAIPGMESIEEVRENVKAGRDRRDFTQEEIELLEKEVSSLDDKFCRRCGYCKPCSVGIDIPYQFILDGYFTRYDMADWAIQRYQAQDIRARDCIECGLCEPKCPYGLDIIDMLAQVEENLG